MVKIVRAPNVRWCGSRQMTRDVVLCAALYFDDKSLFVLGLGSFVIRYLHNIVACYIGGRYLRILLFTVFAALAGIALMSIL